MPLRKVLNKAELLVRVNPINPLSKNEIDAVNKMVRKSVTFLPNMEEHKKYNELFYNVYLKMFPKLKKIYRSIRNFAKK